MALAVIPGAMLISFVSARRVRPIYRSIRKDAEQSTGASAKRSPASASCAPSGASCASCSTTCAARTRLLRKELFAHRRELVLWTSWGCWSPA
jgi:ATP-binding cassette subfamily B protein/subfamily B ATP-binding cassette protein MsbA